jgi:hypothetical protein
LASVAGNAVFLLLALAVIGLLAGVASCGAGASPTAGAGTSGDPTATAAASGDEWIPLRSQSPADILAAARGGSLFKDAQSGTGDGAPDLSRLGIPVFVQALRPAGATADQVPDFDVVPVLNEAGAATDAIELALNPARRAVQEVAIITYRAPQAGGSVAQLQADQAIQLVAAQRHVAVQANGQPYLVYFPFDPQAQADQNTESVWMGGGALPADPIWLVPAADGGTYLAGNDGAVYTPGQLPQATSVSP